MQPTRESGCRTKTEHCCSSESVKKIVRAHEQDLMKMDETSFLKMDFLHNHYDNMMENNMRNLMLEICPDPNERRVLAKAVVAARQLACGPTTMAQRANIQSDMTNAANALLDISTSSGPTGKELSKMTMWIQLFHKKAENFCHILTDADYVPPAGSNASTRPSSGRKNLYGHEALSYMYERAKPLPSGSQDEQDMKQLRMFKWMLSEQQLKQMEEWTRSKIISSKDKIMNRQKALKDIEKQALKDKTRIESCDQTLVVAPPLKKLAVTPKQQNDDDDDAHEEPNNENESGDDCNDSGVLSFFGAKAL